MSFMVSNPKLGLKSYVGVQEFSAEEGMAGLPIWLMRNLLLDTGDEIIVRNMNLQVAQHVVFRPYEHAFMELNSPNLIITREIQKHFRVLSKGETISITYGGRQYQLEVADTKPDNQVLVNQ